MIGFILLVIVLGFIYWLLTRPGIALPEPFISIVLVAMILLIIFRFLALVGVVEWPVGGFR